MIQERLSKRFLARRLSLAAVVAASVLGGARAGADELRGFWVDAWGAGFHSQSEVETLLGQVGSGYNIGRIRESNCNAVFVQVRRRADVCYPSGMGEPYMSGLSPSHFNALQAMIDAAHDTTGGKQRIEVHAWIVVFATSSGGTPSPVYYEHNDPSDPENYWITRDNYGDEPSDKPFDPGHPRAAEYLTDVCMDLVNNFDIDGLHYDYIRFTGSTQGYNPTSIARYNERYGLSGQPSPSDEQFKQWRRDQVTALVRRVYAHVQRDGPETKVSAAVVTWNPSPTSSTRAAFMNTRPYYQVYSDWDAWMEEGILDISVPMTYYNQASLPNDFQRWMNFQKDRKFNRHNVVGPGIYLNSLSNSILQLQKTREQSPGGSSAQGFCGYSYRVPYSGGSWSGFQPSLVSQVTPSPDTIPDMPWKSSPTMGHMMGTVTYYATGEWADGAEVSVAGPTSRSIICDGTGFYAFIDLPPGNYTVTASAGDLDASASVFVWAGNMSEQDFELGGNPGPQISNVQATNVTDDSATITWTTDQPATSQVEYGLTTAYGNLSPLHGTLVTSHSVMLEGLDSNTLYHYRVISTNGNGSATSNDFTFNTSGPPQISNVHADNIDTDTATITWTTDAPATSQVRYGLTAGYGNETPQDPTMVTAHSVTLTGLDPDTLYHYQAVSGNAYGTAESSDYTLRTAGPPDISGVQATNIGATAATIVWDTDVPADSQVEYGLTTGYGSTTPLDPTPTTTHGVPLSGLDPETLYHYRVRSANGAGATYSTDHTFSTIAFVEEIVIDNNDPGWANTSPYEYEWYTGSIPDVPKIGDDYLYAWGVGDPDESAATRKCTWTPQLPLGGVWDVYVFYQMGTNRTSGAPYKVVYNGGELISIENQYSPTSNQGDWFLIGEDLPFLAGASGYVQVSNNTADLDIVSADAAKFVYRGTGDPTPPTTPVVTDDGDYTHSLTELHASWVTSDPETGIQGSEYRILEQDGPVVRDWTDVGTATEVAAGGLALALGKTYRFEVRATNNVGMVSGVGSSNGITVFRFDIDGNGQVDGADTANFRMCLSGANLPYPGGVGFDCGRFDVDSDADVDLEDFGIFQRCLTGQEPIDPSCLGD